MPTEEKVMKDKGEGETFRKTWGATWILGCGLHCCTWQCSVEKKSDFSTRFHTQELRMRTHLARRRELGCIRVCHKMVRKMITAELV